MKIGYFGFNNGPLGNPDSMKQILQALETSGFESAWTGEHIVLIDPQRPPSPVPPEFPMLDTVAALAFAAAATTKLKLGSGIILLAQRNPVVLAKELASVDVLSGGRLLFGIGVGYVKEEFDTLSIEYSERGPRVSDHIEAMRAMWTQDKPEYNGQFTTIKGVQAKPLPIQKPHPPFIIGGMSKAGYQRAIKQGDGWYGFNQTEEAVAESIAGLKAADAAAGTNRLASLEISVTPQGKITPERVEAFAQLGVHRLILLPSGGDTQGTLDFIARTADELKLG